MVDDILFEFLHMEVVHTLVGQPSVISVAGADEVSKTAAVTRPNLMCDDPKKQGELNVTKLEQVGFVTGQKFAEKLTKDYSRFKDELDIIKFICKEFWNALFGKQIDNLRTNHQGVYVLLDQRFKFISRISNSKQFNEQIPRYVAFTCGMTRGALSNLGLEAVVTAELLTAPAIKFQLQIIKQSIPENK